MSLATPNSFLTLTSNAPTFTLPSGAATVVFGTSGADSIVLSAGAAADLRNFNNQGDNVTINSPSTGFNVLVQGTTVIFQQGGADVLRIGASTTPVPIKFSDLQPLNLQISSGQIKLGNQTLTSTPSPIGGGGGGGFTDVIIGAQGTLQSPVTLDAANGAFNFIDAVGVSSSVVITNFGADD